MFTAHSRTFAIDSTRFRIKESLKGPKVLLRMCPLPSPRLDFVDKLKPQKSSLGILYKILPLVVGRQRDRPDGVPPCWPRTTL